MRLFLSIALLLFSAKVAAQKQRTIDSLLVEIKKTKIDTVIVKNLNRIAIAYLKVDSTKGFHYSRKALQMSKKINWKEGIAISNYCIGSHYGENLVFKKAFYHYNQAVLNTKDKRLLSKIYAGFGQSYLVQSNYTKSLEYFHKSLKLCETTKNRKGEIMALTYMGSLYSGLREDEKALSYYLRGLDLSKKSNDDSYLYGLYRGIAVVYSDRAEYEKSLKNFELAYTLSTKKQDVRSQANILSDIALVYLNMENYEQAIAFSKKSLKLNQKVAIKKLDIAFNYGVIGDSFIDWAKKENNNKTLLDSAVTNLNKAIELHKEIESLRSLYDDYTSLTLAQRLQGNYKSALESFEKAIIYRDSIYNSDNKETIQNLEDKREIELRDKEIKINNLKLEAKEKQKWYFIFGLGLLGIIGGLLLYQNQNRKKTNEKLQLLNTHLDQKNHDLDEANKTNARFFGILNHDLRSPVYNLIHFLHLQKENPELLDEETKNSIQAETMTSAENLLQSMEDLLLWSKSQMENFQPQPKSVSIEQLFEDTRKHFSGVANVQFQFENNSNIPLTTDENYLKTIIRNLTGNAIKALEHFVSNNETDSHAALGMTPTIIWKAFQNNGTTILSITDNGKGATKEQFKALYDDKEVVGIKTGLGLHLIRDLAKAIGCKVTVDSQLNEGTTITLTL